MTMAIERAQVQQQQHLLLARRLLALTRVEEIAATVFEALRERLEPDALSLLVADEVSNTHLDLVAGWGWSEAYVGKLELPLGPPFTSCPAWALHVKEAVVDDKTRPDLPFTVPEEVRRAGVQASVVLPMLAEDRPVGAIVADYLKPKSVSPEELSFGTLVGSMAAEAVTRALEHRRYELLFERVPVGLYRSDPTGRIIDANDALVRLVGYPDRESLLQTYAAQIYVDPGDRNKWRQLMDREGVVSGFEVQWRRYDGSTVWVLETARTIRDALGRPAHYEGSVHDITRAKAAEKQLRGYLEELKLLHGITRAVARASDPDEALHTVTREVQAVLGCEHVSILLRRGDRLCVSAAAETVRGMVLELPLGEGITGWVAQTGEPVLVSDVDKDPRYRAGIPETRSELCVPLTVGDHIIGVINAESTRLGAFTEHDLRLLSTVAHEISVIIERSHLLETIQRQLNEITSLREVSATLRAAKTTQELSAVLAECGPRLLRAEAAALSTVDSAKGHMVIAGASGLPVGAVGRCHGADQGISGYVVRTGKSYHSTDLAADPLVVHRDLVVGLGPGLCVPLRTTEGQVVGTLLVARARGNTLPFSADEERLLSTLAEMGGNALQRVSLFEEVSRQQTATELMASLAAHEVRSTTAKILTLLESLEAVHMAKGESDEPGRLIRSALRELEILGLGAEELMDFVGLKTGALRMTMEEVDVEALLEEVVDGLSGLAARKKQRIAVAVQAGLPVLLADRRRLRQVVANLAKNAMEASSKGAYVYLRAAAKEGKVVIEVEDQGPGMSREDLDNIFEPFFRTKSAQRAYGGHGLGLAASKMFVEAHGGHMRVASELGQGTTFRVVLPVPEGREMTGDGTVKEGSVFNEAVPS
jgi:PAS domain S-box-containing protein